MLVNGVDFFALKLGIVLTLIGLLLTVPLSFGPVKVGTVTFSLYKRAQCNRPRGPASL